ncbi:MAG TPA: hypothetical protein VEV20_07325 [Burkholderiales bacterium]|nr:hypothetical protein [Burkholderiales bacterium]
MRSSTRDETEKTGLSRVAASAVAWALVLGVVGFVCGFLGPIALSPDANQGPLLGIFISGPGGALLGAILGLIVGFLPLSKRTVVTSLAVAASAVALVTLYFSTPSPQFRATLLDAEFRGCQMPDALKDKTLADWDERIAKVTWAKPRAGWKEDFERMLHEQQGVVVTLNVLQSGRLYENRKPWNKGTLFLKPWQPEDPNKQYFAVRWGTGCESYAEGRRELLIATGETSKQWPPEILANLLDLPTLEPAPPEYRLLLAK